jgi:predicted transcriptional regulator
METGLNTPLHISSIDDFDKIAKYFYDLSAVSRLRLMYQLSLRSSTASEMASYLNTSQANAIKQLGVLLDAGWIRRTKVNNTFFYRLERAWVIELIQSASDL